MSSPSAQLATPPISRTAVYFAGFIALGLAMTIIGPTLPALAENTGSQLAQISILFTARSLGGLTGSPLSGRLFDRRPGHTIMAGVLLVMSVLLALLPLGNQLWLLVVALFLLGMAEIGLDIGGNTLLVWLHGERVSPYMNAMHFFFGVGAFFAPLILAQMLQWADGPAGVRWTYWLLALLMLPVAAWLARLPSPTPHENSDGDQNTRPAPRWLLLLLAAFFMLYVGVEVSFGGWIFSYATVRDLVSPVTAAYLTSIFWGALMVGRLISVPLAQWLRPQTILAGGLLGGLVGVVGLLSRPDSIAVLYVGTFVIGLFLAPIFPTTLSFAERRMAISGRVTSWFFIGATLGGMTLPWMAGQVLDRINPLAFLVQLAVNLVVAIVVYLLLVITTSGKRRKTES